MNAKPHMGTPTKVNIHTVIPSRLESSPVEDKLLNCSF